jgi:nitrogen-specific signal transduction histidine kinase
VRTGKTAGSSAFLEVANSGPVVPDDLVPSLFEPFPRIEEAAST